MGEWQQDVFLPDIQAPYHDRSLVTALQEFVSDFQPDALYQVGDLLDAPEPSRWNKGMAGEYEGTLQKSIDETVKILEGFREAHSGPLFVKLGNHDARVEDYCRRYAPAFTSLRALRFEELLQLERLDVELLRKIAQVAPGWVLAHGHEGRLNRVAGSTAMSLARQVGQSVVCGHTHRAGLQFESSGFNGKVRTLTGLEIGHAMDMRKAGYLKTGGGNWQQAFGILRRNGTTVIPELVRVVNRQFVVDGQAYKF